MSEFIKAVTAANFEQEVIQKSKTTPVLIDFWADWCAPCKQLMPLLHQITESLNGALHLATVNTDAEQELSMNYGIRSLPTVLLMKNGEIVEQFMGVQPESEIRKLLKPHLTAATEKPQNSGAMQKALELINNNQALDAIPYLQQEESLDGKLLLIKVYLQEGEIEKAKETFESLTNEQQQDSQLLTIKTSLNLIELAQESENPLLKSAINHTLSVDAVEGIEQLLELLSLSKADEKKPIQASLIMSFNFIEDAKLVSQLRRKMAALIF